MLSMIKYDTIYSCSSVPYCDVFCWAAMFEVGFYQPVLFVSIFEWYYWLPPSKTCYDSVQTEADFDENADRLEKRLDDASRAAETREERLRIDNHLLKRSNLRLKGDLAIEKKKMERMLKDNTALREGMVDQQVKSWSDQGSQLGWTRIKSWFLLPIL